MSVPETSATTASSVGTLKRGLSILQHIAAQGEATPASVATVLQSSRSTTYRIIETLRAFGFLEINPVSGQLRLGPRARELGMAALSDVDVIAAAPTFLRSLGATTMETVFLAVPALDEMVYVGKEESPRPVRMSCQLGSRRPMHSTALGKAYLSALPEDERRQVIGRLDLVRFTTNTITDPERLEAAVVASAAQGFAFDDVEGEEGVSCLAAPVRDFSRRPVGAISVSGPTERVVSRKAEIGRQVAHTAAGLSRRIGYVPRGEEGDGGS